MRPIKKSDLRLELRKEINQYNKYWWDWYYEYDDDWDDIDDSWSVYYTYVDGYIGTPYSVVDMDSFYSIEELRNKKLENLFNSNVDTHKNLTTTLEDFYNHGKNSSK